MATTYIHGNIGLTKFRNGQGATVAFKNTTISGDSSVTAVPVDVKEKASGMIAAWGPNNDYPQKVLEAIKKNASATAALSFRCDSHYGNGQIFLRMDATDDGKHDHKVVPINTLPDIQEFYRRSKMQMFWKETIVDLEHWRIAFPEYILSNNFATINRVKRQKTPWCRFELMNEDSGLVEHVYISQKFGKDSVNLESKFVAKVPLIDSYWTAEEVREYCKANKIYNFIRPVFYPMVDEAYYPEGGWHSIVRSGWLEVANNVPSWVKNMFQNAANINLHIEIDERYYESIFRDTWGDMTKDERDAERKKTIDAIDEHLTKPENAGKSITTMLFVDSEGKQQSAVKITVIDNQYKEGAYLPQAEAANSEILFAFRVDPSLIGAGIPGGKLGAGSGSDKNAAFNISNALFKTNRETTLEVFDFVRDYNGWDPSLTAAFENTLLVTLDKNPTGSQKTT